MTASGAEISRYREVMWASGSLATASAYNAMALFSLFYMTSILGMSPGLAGSLLFLTKLYDAFTDPVMGAISDRTRHRLGPRRPYVAAGALLLGGSFALFFNLPQLSGGGQVVAVLVALLVYSTCYTVFAVPYLAMPPDIAPAYDARTRLMTFRVSFMIVGVLLGSALAPMVVEMAGDGRRGYGALGVSLGILAAGAGLLAFFGTRGVGDANPGRGAQPRHSSLAAEARSALGDAVAVFRNAPFRLLTLVKLLQLAVLALVLACTPYFFRYVLERSTGDITYYLLTFSLSGLLSLSIWRAIIKRYGKRNVYIVSIVAYALGLLSWFLWVPGEREAFFYLRAVFIGVMSNGTLLCALSLLPDTMEHDRLVSGRNREGVMSGVFTTVEKVAGALGPLIIGVLLQAMGLVTGRSPDVVQPESALLAVKLGMAVVPALLCVAAVPLLLRYELGPRELESLRKSAAATSPAS